jgi:hypothetical protein
MIDIIYPLLSDDDTLTKDSALSKWSELLHDIFTKNGRPMDSALKYKDQLEAAGFVDVNIVKRKWPLNRWPKDPKHKQIGQFSPISNFSSAVTNGVDRHLGPAEHIGCFGSFESRCLYTSRWPGWTWLE